MPWAGYRGGKRAPRSIAEPAAIDIPRSSSLNEFYPLINVLGLPATRSRLAVAQSVCTLHLRLLTLVLGGITCLLASAQPAYATGCHLPDRPVLARTLSWERWLRTGPGFGRGDARPAPPALAPLPCQGETPTTPGIGVTVVADQPAAPTFISPPLARESLPVDSAGASPHWLALRVDRPPRRLSPFQSHAG
jgi:hypothetical protein